MLISSRTVSSSFFSFSLIVAFNMDPFIFFFFLVVGGGGGFKSLNWPRKNWTRLNMSRIQYGSKPLDLCF